MNLKKRVISIADYIVLFYHIFMLHFLDSHLSEERKQ